MPGGSRIGVANVGAGHRRVLGTVLPVSTSSSHVVSTSRELCRPFRTAAAPRWPTFEVKAEVRVVRGRPGEGPAQPLL